MPSMPPWFCAAIWSMRGRRIDRICDLGGSLPPVKPSMRMIAPGGDMALSAASISSGSSGSAAICSRVSTVENALPRGSRAGVCLSRPTTTSSVTFFDGQDDGPARSRRRGAAIVLDDDGLEAGELGGDRVPAGRETVDRGEARGDVVRRRESQARRPSPARPARSTVTVAPGITPPLGSADGDEQLRTFELRQLRHFCVLRRRSRSAAERATHARSQRNGAGGA